MLKPACQAFRDTFEPRRADTLHPADEHRASCAACDAWAVRLEALLEPSPERGLPDRLHRRLLAIPVVAAGQTFGDSEHPEADLLVETLRRRAHDETVDDKTTDDKTLEASHHAALDHLADCPRCRELGETLSCAMTPRLHRVPERLRRRLLAIAAPARRPVPWWVRDGRLAIAASLFLTVLLSTVAGDALAGSAEQQRLRGLDSAQTVLVGAGSGMRRGWFALVRQGEVAAAYGDRLVALADKERLLGFLKQKALDLYTPKAKDRGERDGKQREQSPRRDRSGGEHPSGQPDESTGAVGSDDPQRGDTHVDPDA